MEHQPILESLDPEIAARIAVREGEIANGASTSRATAAGLAMASIPIALAAASRDVFAQGGLPQNVINVLNFALTLEYLESTFYDLGLGVHHIVPHRDREIFEQIRRHENEHVAYLKAALGSAAIAKPKFDFSGGGGSGDGPFRHVFRDYDTFKALSQAFEDTGVRAYKGQAANLITVKAILTVALQIHSVEARHASEVRRLRGEFRDRIPHRGWITQNFTDIPGTAANYAGEQNVDQGGVDIVTLGFPIDAATEAFDEPLTTQQVLAIASAFIAA
jgi:rubrerythrin